VRVLDHPDAADVTIDDVLRALADPVRRKIVRQLMTNRDAQSCSCFALPVGKSTQTHHFRVLREAGIISQEYQGTSIMSSLRRDVIDERIPGLLDAILAAED
jgi:DNA-binding transcriptional ArsR family regulator